MGTADHTAVRQMNPAGDHLSQGAVRAAEGRDGHDPTVTVIIATYNRPALVPRAIASVRRQTYDDWELVIVDDASTEDSAAALAAHLEDERVRLVRRRVNGGAGASRNTGLAAARGRFVCFLDDDDEFFEHKLARQVQQLEAAGDDVVGVVGRCVRPWTSIDDRPTGEVRPLHRGDILNFRCPATGTELVRREAAVAIRFSESMRVVLEWDFFIGLLERHYMLRDDVPTMVWHNDAPTRLSMSQVCEAEQLYQKYLSEITRDRSLHARWKARLALDSLRAGEPRAARRHAATALRLAPADPRRWYLLASTFAGTAPRRWLVTLYRRLGGRRKRWANRGGG